MSKEFLEIATEKVRKRDSNDFDLEIIALQKQFTDALGTRVQIQKTEFGGRLAIDYFTREDLEVLLKKMNTDTTQAQGFSVNDGADAISSLNASTPLVTKAEEPAPQQEQQISTENQLKSITQSDSDLPVENNLLTEDTTSAEPEPEPEMNRMKSILAGLTANLQPKEKEVYNPITHESSETLTIPILNIENQMNWLSTSNCSPNQSSLKEDLDSADSMIGQ